MEKKEAHNGNKLGKYWEYGEIIIIVSFYLCLLCGGEVIISFIWMFYKLLELFTENEQINGDVIQLCHVMGSHSSSSNFPTRLINKWSSLWREEEGKS